VNFSPTRRLGFFLREQMASGVLQESASIERFSSLEPAVKDGCYTQLLEKSRSLYRQERYSLIAAQMTKEEIPAELRKNST